MTLLSEMCESARDKSLGSRGWVRRAPIQLAILAITAYQGLIRPFLFGTCRYCPTCSAYAIEALRTHGLLRGVRLSVSRVLRCRPLARGGYDPVPPPRSV